MGSYPDNRRRRQDFVPTFNNTLLRDVPNNSSHQDRLSKVPKSWDFFVMVVGVSSFMDFLALESWHESLLQYSITIFPPLEQGCQVSLAYTKSGSRCEVHRQGTQRDVELKFDSVVEA